MAQARAHQASPEIFGLLLTTTTVKSTSLSNKRKVSQSIPTTFLSTKMYTSEEAIWLHLSLDMHEGWVEGRGERQILRWGQFGT